MTDVPDEAQRWTVKRKAAVVMSSVTGDTSAAEAARKHGLTVAEIERWKEQFFAACQNALLTRPRDEEAAKDEQMAKLQRKVGELILHGSLLREVVTPGYVRWINRNGGPLGLPSGAIGRPASVRGFRRGVKALDRTGIRRRRPPAVSTYLTLEPIESLLLRRDRARRAGDVL